MKRLIAVTVPSRSLLPLAYAKLEEIGLTVESVYVPTDATPTTTYTEGDPACPVHGTPMEPDVGMVCGRCG